MNQAAMMRLKKMQREMEAAQKKLQETIFTGTSGGIVTVQVRGDNEVMAVKIDEEAFESKDDIEMIEAAIVAAIADAKKKIDAETQRILGPLAGMTGGLF